MNHKKLITKKYTLDTSVSRIQISMSILSVLKKGSLVRVNADQKSPHLAGKTGKVMEMVRNLMQILMQSNEFLFK